MSRSGFFTRRRLVVLAVAVAVTVAVVLAIVLAGGDGNDDSGQDPTRSGTVALRLQSRADLRPPEVVVDRRATSPGGARILISPRADEKVKVPGHQQGGMILDEHGRTLWFGRVAGDAPILNLQIQRYRGKPVLTWWQGALEKGGIGSGKAVVVDRNYRRIATVRTDAGLGLDLHEFLLTPRGTALVMAYNRARADLRPVGGAADGRVTEGVLQEIDVESGRVLWEWHSLDHVDPSESVEPLPDKESQSYDYFHINSVEEDRKRGTLLVSARNTSAVYEIDRRSGRVLARIGGKKSDFAMGPGTEFGLQHDARYASPDRIEIFDNGPEETKPPSSGKVLDLDRERRKATLVRRLEQPQGLWAESQGSAQFLPGGGAFVGWGSLGRFSRFDEAGELVFDAHLPQGYDSYRAYLADWSAEPREPPAIAAQREGAQTIVYASWNGATEVDNWQVLAGQEPGSLKPVGRPTPWDGLETRISVTAPQPFVAVRAVDSNGRAIGRSKAVRPRPGP